MVQLYHEGQFGRGSLVRIYGSFEGRLALPPARYPLPHPSTLQFILIIDTRKGGGPSSIFTISVDASGRRLASAGLDSTIRVWNLDALHNPSEPKLLAAMTRHDGNL